MGNATEITLTNIKSPNYLHGYRILIFLELLNPEPLNPWRYMDIRFALKTDLPAIISLTRQLGYSIDDQNFNTNFISIIDNPSHAIFVAEDSDNTIIGYIHALPKELLISPDSLEIGELIVDEHYRRQGIGKQLVEKVEHWGVEHEYKSIIVGSSTKRITSHKFYSDIGYKYWKEQIVYLKVLE